MRQAGQGCAGELPVLMSETAFQGRDYSLRIKDL
jgi:hypothetical protein